MSPSHPFIREEESIHSGVWGVRNYYTTLERRAVAGAAVTPAFGAMVVAASVMATAGLLLDSPAVVVGSMCVAPFMAPSRAVCIGILFGDRRVFLAGLLKQVLALLLVGGGIAFLMTVALNATVGGLEITDELLLRAMPTPRDVVLSVLIAAAAGAAASLALITPPSTTLERPWGSVADVVIGVQIAISLLPPAAVIGISLALGTPTHAWNALLLLLLNVVGLDVVGSVSVLAIRGVRRSYLDTEKQVRGVVGEMLEHSPGIVSVGSTVDVMLSSAKEARIDVILRREFYGEVPDDLASRIVSKVFDETSCTCDIAIEVVPVLTYTSVRRDQAGEHPGADRGPPPSLGA